MFGFPNRGPGPPHAGLPWLGAGGARKCPDIWGLRSELPAPRPSREPPALPCAGKNGPFFSVCAVCLGTEVARRVKAGGGAGGSARGGRRPCALAGE